MEESKREAFKRLAEARTQRILDMLRILGNCSNRSNYDYTEEDVTRIFDAIEYEVRSTKQMFICDTTDKTFKLR